MTKGQIEARTAFIIIILLIALILIAYAIYTWWTTFQEKAEVSPGAIVRSSNLFSLESSEQLIFEREEVCCLESNWP